MLRRIAALRPRPRAAARYSSKSTSLPQKQQRVRDHAFDGIMEVQKRVRRFLALHSLLLYAASPTAPSGAFSGGGSGAMSVPFSRLGALARRQLRLQPLDAGRFFLRHPHAFHLFLHPVHRVLHTHLTPRAASTLRLEAEAVVSSLPASASSSSSRPRTTASASSAATSASSTTSPTPSSYPTTPSSASPPISSSSSCPPPPTSPLPPSSAPESATIASTVPPAPARRTRASRFPSASRRDLRSARTSALQFGSGSASRPPLRVPVRGRLGPRPALA